MPPQRTVRRTGTALTAGAFALVFTGTGFAGTGTASADTRECPAGTGLVSTLTGVVCSTTTSATQAGKNLLDGGTGGTTSPITSTAKRTTDGLVGGAHATATRAEGGTDDGDEGAAGGADKSDDKPSDSAARRSWTSFPGGFTPRERTRFLDSRYPAPYAALPTGPLPGPGAFGFGPAIPEAPPPRVAPALHLPLPLHHSAVLTSAGSTGEAPSTAAVTAAAGMAGAVVALHLGLVDRWRDRRSQPRRPSPRRRREHRA